MQRILPCVHPGTHVKRELDYLKLSINAYAKMIGVNPSTVSRLVNGDTGVSAEMAVRLAATIGSTPEMWLRLQSSYDLEQAKNSIDVSNFKKLEAVEPTRI